MVFLLTPRGMTTRLLNVASIKRGGAAHDLPGSLHPRVGTGFRRPRLWLQVSAAAAMVLAIVPGCAQAAAGQAADVDTANGVAPVQQQPAGAAPVLARPATTTTVSSTDAQRFCQNVAAAAAEARNAWQAKKLADLQAQVSDTIAQLEAREAALKDVLARRDEALKRADGTLVGIFGKMKPDAAAAELSALDDDTAAAVLQQLNPRAAGAILNEIQPDRAARLVTTIAGPPPADGKKL